MTPVDKNGIDACAGSAADIIEGVTDKHGTSFICTKQGHGLEGRFGVWFMFYGVGRGYQDVKISGSVGGIEDFLQAEASSRGDNGQFFACTL